MSVMEMTGIVKLLVYDSNANSYTLDQHDALIALIDMAKGMGYGEKWDDHNGWSWGYIVFPDEYSAAMFKLEYM